MAMVAVIALSLWAGMQIEKFRNAGRTVSRTTYKAYTPRVLRPVHAQTVVQPVLDTTGNK
jgi:hypothetical protein